MSGSGRRKDWGGLRGASGVGTFPSLFLTNEIKEEKARCRNLMEFNPLRSAPSVRVLTCYADRHSVVRVLRPER